MAEEIKYGSRVIKHHLDKELVIKKRNDEIFESPTVD